MKKIIQVVRKFSIKNWGGYEQYVLKSSQYLYNLGYRVKVYTTLAFSEKIFESIDGVQVYRFPYFYPVLGLDREEKIQLDRKGGFPISFKMLLSLLKENKIDLIHSHDIGNLGKLVRFICKKRKVPYITHTHSTYYNIPEADKEAMQKPIKDHINFNKAYNLLFGRTDNIIKDSAACFSSGIDEYEYIKNKFPNIKVFHIPIGVNFNKFTRANPKNFLEKYNIVEENIILNVARIDVQKNQLIALDCIPYIITKFPSTKFIFIGPVSNNTYYDKFKAKIIKMKLERYILFIPELPPESQDLINAYASCNIFILPSIHEGQSVVIPEAWAAGKPVIASNVGGVSYTVSDGENGLLFESGDVEKFQQKLLLLIERKDLAFRLGENGNKKAKEEYDWKIIIKRIASIYEEIIRDYNGR